MSHPDFHNGHYHYLRQLSILTIRHLLQKDLKLLLRQEMTVEDIKTTVKDFQNAAINAVKAGFDGVEIHSSNGYLFQQFFNGTANHRTDEYGGSIENKARIFFEVLDAVKEVIPEEKIGARFNPWSIWNNYG
jgi:N-ethylmaleimide reductase